MERWAIEVSYWKMDVLGSTRFIRCSLRETFLASCERCFLRCPIFTPLFL